MKKVKSKLTRNEDDIKDKWRTKDADEMRKRQEREREKATRIESMTQLGIYFSIQCVEIKLKN